MSEATPSIRSFACSGLRPSEWPGLAAGLLFFVPFGPSPQHSLA